MEVSGALLAFAAGAAILIATILGSLNVTLPLGFGCVLLVIGVIFVLQLQPKKTV